MKEKRKEKWLGCEKSTLGKAEMSDGEENMTRKKERNEEKNLEKNYKKNLSLNNKWKMKVW